MKQKDLTFVSEGSRMNGMLRLPDDAGSEPLPAVVQGPGWLGLKDSKLYIRYHEAFTSAGYAVFIFDYRGFGDSDGDRGLLLPSMQLEDLVNAVTYVGTLAEIDANRIGVFGTGGTGGGNAIMLAAADRRVKCAVAQVPVADGEDWLHRMRREYEWYEFLARLDVDRVTRVTGGEGEMVHPREEIMVPTPERRATKVKSDVDDRIPNSVPLRCAEAIMAYKPIDVVDRIAPRALLVVGVEGDATTPTDHSVALYEAAGNPKKLIMQRHTTHYAAYDRYWNEVTPQMVAWLDSNMGRGDLVVRTKLDNTERHQSVVVSAPD